MTRARRSPRITPLLLILAAAGAIPAAASAQSGDFSLSASVERISGDYGGDVSFEDMYVPLTAMYERERIAFRVTVPYIEIEFQDPADATKYTESGVGDTVVGLTFFDVLRSGRGLWLLDLTTKVELATGDEDRGLGNGETDVALVADVWRQLDGGAFIASVGYKSRGTSATTLDDSWSLSLGGMRRFNAALTGSLFVDQRQSAIPGRETIREITASISRRLADDWRLRFHVARGLSDASIDSAAGISIRRDF